MDNSIQQTNESVTQEQMLAEILANSRKTKNYMKWQLIITVALVVIPLLAALIMIPIALNSVTSVFSSYGLDGLSGAGAGGGSGSTIQDLINQYTK